MGTSLHDRPEIMGDASRALDIADDGTIVGQAQFEQGGPSKPALWTRNDVIDVFLELPEGQGMARAISPTAGPSLFPTTSTDGSSATVSATPKKDAPSC